MDHKITTFEDFKNNIAGKRVLFLGGIYEIRPIVPNYSYLRLRGIITHQTENANNLVTSVALPKNEDDFEITENGFTFKNGNHYFEWSDNASKEYAWESIGDIHISV